MGNPFDRKAFYMSIPYYIDKGWGTYKELIELSIRDFMEIKVGIESKLQEDQLAKAVGS